MRRASKQRWANLFCSTGERNEARDLYGWLSRERFESTFMIARDGTLLLGCWISQLACSNWKMSASLNKQLLLEVIEKAAEMPDIYSGCFIDLRIFNNLFALANRAELNAALPRHATAICLQTAILARLKAFFCFTRNSKARPLQRWRSSSLASKSSRLSF